MTKRESISKRLRFEVFKRDSFTCQYCGSKAPEVILNIDHINPVSNGGENEIMNLITSCFSCNSGKSDKLLSDNSIVEKQRKQIEELNLRRQQLEMMLEWRDGQKSIKNVELEKCIEYWNSKFKTKSLNDFGKTAFEKLLKKHELIKILDAIDKSFDKYFKTEDDCELIFQKIGGILSVENMPEYMQKIYYIIGICKNKDFYINKPIMINSLSRYHEVGNDLFLLEKMLKQNEFKNYSQFMDFIIDNS